MKPMGYDKEDDLLYQELLKQQNEAAASSDYEEVTQIAYPEDRYGLACIGCGIEMHLQMIPHRNDDNILVGWVFSCEKCRPNIIGQNVWFGSKGNS